MYQKQLEQNMAALTARLYELYGSRWDFYQILERLEAIMKKASAQRQTGYLAQADEEAVVEFSQENSLARASEHEWEWITSKFLTEDTESI